MGTPSVEYKQRAYVANASKTRWAVSPKVGGVFLPLGLGYLVVDCADDYSTTIVGAPGAVRPRAASGLDAAWPW